MTKNKIVQNTGLKIAALIFAALLWLIVVNVDDPVDSMVFRNIPVTVTNEEVITNQGKAYQIVDGTKTVNVTIYATRSALSKMTADNVVAVADLSQMEVNTLLVPIMVTVKGFEGRYTQTETQPNNLQVKIEDMVQNIFPISASASGTPRDGYMVGTMTANPERITVRGPESIVRSVSKVVARVDVSGLSKDSTLEAQLIYYDGNGNVMDASQLKNNLGDAGVSVDVQMLHIKEVGLNFAVSGTPKSGYIYTGWSCEPQNIQVCGTEDALEGLDMIEIPRGAVNIDKKSGNTTFTVDIAPYLPEGIYLADESSNKVVVTVMIEQQGVKTLDLPIEAVRVDNLASNLKVSFAETTGLSFQFSGQEELLETLDIRNAAYIDLKDYTTPGSYEVEVNVDVSGEIQLTQKPKITVVLTGKEEDININPEEEE